MRHIYNFLILCGIDISCSMSIFIVVNSQLDINRSSFQSVASSFFLQRLVTFYIITDLVLFSRIVGGIITVDGTETVVKLKESHITSDNSCKI
jgi:hypothetical protein